MPSQSWQLFLSCEHGGNWIPAKWRKYLLPEDARDLETHRGWDIGALSVARIVQKKFGCPLLYSKTSRLLIDLNRSSHHPRCFGSSYRALSSEIKNEILETYYQPYRDDFRKQIRQEMTGRQKIIHIAVHSFTPILAGEVRQADLSLLYDPGRKFERHWVSCLLKSWREENGQLKFRRNYPYRGTSDGLTTAMRCQFNEASYVGLELEINQKFISHPEGIRDMGRFLCRGLEAALKHPNREAI